MKTKYYIDKKGTYYTQNIDTPEEHDVPHVGKVVVHPVTEEKAWGLIDLESYLFNKSIEYMEDNFEKGHTFKVTFFDGGKATVRTFMNQGEVYFFKGRATTRGYSIWGYPRIEGGRFASVELVPTPPAIEQYVSNLKKFKRAFTKRAHTNLWKNFQDGYKSFDIEKFKKFVENGDYEDSSYGCYKALGDFPDVSSENIVTENRYKTTTIRANRPQNGRKYRSHMSGDYATCTENIQRHLDNKEDFNYSWRSNYDVTVSGNMCGDSVYRAWLSLEYYDCANGHYYALINSNSAVFLEKD